MATDAEMKKIAVRAIEEDAFRNALRADPAKAAATMGITFSQDQLDEMKKRKEILEQAGIRESKMFQFFW